MFLVIFSSFTDRQKVMFIIRFAPYKFPSAPGVGVGVGVCLLGGGSGWGGGGYNWKLPVLINICKGNQSIIKTIINEQILKMETREGNILA